jgi:hypothetical protein
MIPFEFYLLVLLAWSPLDQKVVVDAVPVIDLETCQQASEAVTAFAKEKGLEDIRVSCVSSAKVGKTV